MESSVKYYLAEQMPLKWNVTTRFGRGDLHMFNFYTSMSVEAAKVRCIDVSPQKELVEKLIAAFGNEPLTWTLNLRKETEAISMSRKAENEFRVTFSKGSALKKVLGETACVQAKIFLDSGYSYRVGLMSFSSQEMPVVTATLVKEKDQLMFVDSPHNAMVESGKWECGTQYEGKLDLLVIDKARLHQAGLKRMLEKEIVTDAVIVSNNGAGIKCHRSFLSTHSDVFCTMFGTDMQEAKRQKVEMPDMSEEAVRAFLAYLYHCDLSKAEDSCSVALELLKAGHKYNIGILQNAVRRLMLTKPESWYEIDVAIKLYLFVYNLDAAEREQLQRKVVMVMKKNYADLEKSATFKELFRDNTEAAMKLFQYSISVMVFDNK